MIRTVLTALILCVATPSTQAQNYVALESLGTTQELGTSLYQNTPRSALVPLIKQTRPTGWITLDKAIKQLMLSDADASLIENNVPIKKNEDILTLRLNYLLKNGMNKDALKLYNTTESKITTEPLARLGTIAMLLNQQKAQACLETKTFFNKYQNSSFWNELNAYCSISLSETEQPEAVRTILESQNEVLKSIIQSKLYNYEYEPVSFANLSYQQRALLVSEDRIKLSLKEPSAYKDIPLPHLGALTTQSNIENNVRLHLFLRATDNDIIPHKYLTTLFDTLSNKSSEGPTLDIIKLYAKMKKASKSPLKTPNQEDISQSFKLAEEYGNIILVPFLPMLEKTSHIKHISISRLKTLLKLYILTNKVIPSKLNKKIRENLERTKTPTHVFNALKLLSKEEDKRKNTTEHQSSPPLPSQKIWTNIIENIDKNKNNAKNLMYIYEKDFDLRNNKRYTLPPYEVLMSLKQSSENQNISMTLLLSALALSANETKATYRGTLTEVAYALSRTGLNRVSNGILAQAILETE